MAVATIWLYPQPRVHGAVLRLFFETAERCLPLVRVLRPLAMAGGNSARFLPLLLVAVVAAMAFYLGLVSSNGARSPPARTPTAGAGEDVATSISRLGARLDTVARSVEASKATAEDTNAVVKASAGGHLRHSDGSSAPCDATVEDPVKQVRRTVLGGGAGGCARGVGCSRFAAAHGNACRALPVSR